MKHLLTFIIAAICGISAGVIIAATVTALTKEPTIEEGRAALLNEAWNTGDGAYRP